MRIRLRKAEREDIDGLATLLAGLFSLETDFIVDKEKQKAGLALFLAGLEGKALFVAENDGVLVGMVTAQLVISTAAGGYSILMEDMYITESCRRHGIGTALMQMVQNWGDENGALRIQLLADERNMAAHVFYKKLGFQVSRMIGFYMPLKRGTYEIC
jgi:GNAT superfamily N-acetyltransferase